MNVEPLPRLLDDKSVDSSGQPASIMVVDDTPTNLQLLTTVLQQNGYAVRSAISGAAALQSLEFALPDLVLLDARMPFMDGYAVCLQLKAAQRTREIPVIFISGLQETEDKLKAFEAGGVDYITKPFHIPEVLVRVNTHLSQMRLRRTLADQNRHLDEIVRLRTQELLTANRQLALLDRTKSDFLTLLSHELRTPLNGLFGAAEMAFGDLPPGAPPSEFQQMYEVSRHRVMGLLDDALLLAEIQFKRRNDSSSGISLDEVLSLLQPLARELARPWKCFPVFPTSDLGSVLGEPEILQRAFLCLLETCLKCYPTGPSAGVMEPVRITALAQPGAVSLTFTTSQHTLPVADLDRFFEALAVSQPFPGGDLGLAPALAACIFSLFGGRTWVRNLEPAGIELTIRLPRPPSPLPVI